MKIKTYICNGLFTSLAFLFFNCSDNSSSAEKVKMASVPKGFVSSKEIGDAITVKEFRESNQTNTPFIVEGFIGGRKKPLAKIERYLFLVITHLRPVMRFPGIVAQPHGMYAVKIETKLRLPPFQFKCSIVMVPI